MVRAAVVRTITSIDPNLFNCLDQLKSFIEKGRKGQQGLKSAFSALPWPPDRLTLLKHRSIFVLWLKD